MKEELIFTKQYTAFKKESNKKWYKEGDKIRFKLSLNEDIIEAVISYVDDKAEYAVFVIDNESSTIRLSEIEIIE